MDSTAKIYLIEDDAAVRDALTRVLKVSGYAVTAFASSEAFLEKVDEITQGVLILDIRLAGMSGIDLYTELRTMGNDIPVIFITGHSDRKMIKTMVQSGIVAILEKPFEHTELLKKIETATSSAVS